jgi:hypothetical protein
MRGTLRDTIAATMHRADHDGEHDAVLRVQLSAQRKLAMEYYSTFFSSRWSETWYRNVSRPIADAAVDSEAVLDAERDDPNLFFRKAARGEHEPHSLIMETQIGLMLVLCQTYITTIIQRLNAFYGDYEYFVGDPIPDLPRDKQLLLSTIGDRVSGTDIGVVELVDALANYFKHHEEWPADRRSMRPNERRTEKIVGRVGCDTHMTLLVAKTLSTGILSVGVDRMHDLPKLLEVVDDWKLCIGARLKPFLHL